MSDMERDVIAGSEAQQKVEHHHRINTARYGENNPLSRHQHPMPIDRLLNPMKQCVPHRVETVNQPLAAIPR
jgi:hypothetical protein